MKLAGRLARARTLRIGLALALLLGVVGLVLTRVVGDGGDGGSGGGAAFGTGIALPEGVVARDVQVDIQAYQPNVVRIPKDEVERSLVGITADEVELTFRNPPAALAAVQPDQVVLLEGYSLLRVVETREEGGDFVLAGGPAQITELLKDATIEFTAPVDFSHGARLGSRFVDPKPPAGPTPMPPDPGDSTELAGFDDVPDAIPAGDAPADGTPGDPYAGAGARQVPGPETTTTALPTTPTSIQVDAPPNPDDPDLVGPALTAGEPLDATSVTGQSAEGATRYAPGQETPTSETPTSQPLIPDAPSDGKPPALKVLGGCGGSHCASFQVKGGFQVLIRYKRNDSGLHVDLDAGLANRDIGQVQLAVRTDIPPLETHLRLAIRNGQLVEQDVRTVFGSIHGEYQVQAIQKAGEPDPIRPLVEGSVAKLDWKQIACQDPESDLCEQRGSVAHQVGQALNKVGQNLGAVIGTIGRTLAGSSVIANNMELKVPIPIAGIPFYAAFTVDFTATPAFTTYNGSAGFRGSFGLPGNVDVHLTRHEGGDFSSEHSTEGDIESKMVKQPFLIGSAGPAFLSWAASAPKVSIGIGTMGMAFTLASASLKLAVDQKTPGTLLPVPVCSRTDGTLSMQAAVGEAQLDANPFTKQLEKGFGIATGKVSRTTFDATSTPLISKTLWEKRFFYTNPKGVC